MTKRESKKGRNLYANPKVAIHLESGDDVVAFQGYVVEVADEQQLAQIATAYSMQYQGDQIYPDEVRRDYVEVRAALSSVCAAGS